MLLLRLAGEDDDAAAEKARVAEILIRRLGPQADSAERAVGGEEGSAVGVVEEAGEVRAVGGDGSGVVVEDASEDVLPRLRWDLERSVLLERVTALENESRAIAKRLLQQQAVTAQEMASLEIENESLRSYVDKLMGQVRQQSHHLTRLGLAWLGMCPSWVPLCC